MKNIISSFLIFYSVTSFAQKAEYDVINDFLEVELRDYKYDSIHVQIEPFDVRGAIKLYEQGYKERNYSEKDNETVWVNPYTFKDWPFTEEDIKDVSEKLNRTDKNWSKADFKDKNFVFKRASVLKDRKFRISHVEAWKKEYILRLSHTVFDRQKKYALFQFYLSELILGGSREDKHMGAIIMKKVNNKWIALASIKEAVYN